MGLIMNNLKALGLHLLMIMVSVVLVMLCVISSPIYPTELIAKVVIFGVYGLYILGYIKLGSYLKLEADKRKDYLVGILILLVGICLWFFTVAHSQCDMMFISEEVAGYWIPYNLYTFPSWLFLYGNRNPLVLLMGNLVPGILLTIGMKIKRYRLER